MTEQELKLCEQFERQANTLLLLNAVKSNLTDKGLETYHKIKNWIDENLEKYLELTDS